MSMTRRRWIVVALLMCTMPAGRAQTTTLNLSRDLVPLGIAARNLVPNQPSLDAGPLLMAGVEYAKSHGVGNVAVDRGAYYFLSLLGGIHVNVYRANNLVIDFQGSDLYLAHPNSLGLNFYECENLTLQNFTLDYLKLPFTQLRVVAVDVAARRIHYEVPPGWFDPTVFNVSRGAFGLPEQVHAFFYREGQVAAGTTRFTVQRPMTSTSFTLAPSTYYDDSNEVVARIQPGDTAVVTARGGADPIYVNTGDRVTVRNVRVYSSGLNGLVFHGTTRSLIERVYVMPRPGTDRLISVNADGITLDGPGPGNIVRLSRAIRTLDDGFSPHSLISGIVVNRIDTRTVMVQRQYSNVFRDGAPMVFQSPANGNIVGGAVVVAQSPPASEPPVFEGLVQVRFDRDVTPAVVGAAMFSNDPADRGDGLVLERSAVLDQGFARGMTLWGLMNATIRGNFVRNAHLTAIMGFSRLFPADWRAPALENVVIRNNVVEGAISNFGHGTTEKMAAIQFVAQEADFDIMGVSPHRDIRVIDNFVGDSARSAIRLENVTGGEISRNTIENANTAPDIDGLDWETFEPYRTEFRTPIVVKTSSGVAGGGNQVFSDAPRLTVVDSLGQTLAAYSPDREVLVEGTNVSTFRSGVLIDADGARHNLTVEAVSRDVARVRLPVASALGGAVIEVADGAAVARAMLFIDDRDNDVLRPTTLGVARNARASLSGGSLTVSWERPAVGPTPDGYVLQFRQGGNLVASVPTAASATFTTPVPPALHGAFTVAVRALFDTRTGPFGLPLTFSLGAVPGTPTSVQTFVGPTALRATWQAPSGGATPSAYRLEFRTGGALVASLDVLSTTVEVPIPPGISGAFSLTITALAGAVPGAPSAPTTFTIGTTGCTEAPAAPAVTGRIELGRGSVNWPPVPGAVQYSVQAGTAQGGANLLSATNVGLQTSVSASGLPAGFAAWVRVTATNGCGSRTADFLLQ